MGVTVRERDIEKYLCQQVKKLGGVCWKWMGRTGAPDRMVFLPNGVTYLVEVKAPTGRLSALQRWSHDRLEKLGHRVEVVWSKDDIDALLNGGGEHD